MNCKYNHDAECWNTNRYCTCIKNPSFYCSKNPNRFNNKEVTEGQIKFLESKGYSREDIKKMSFLEASNLIDSLKPHRFDRLY